MTEEAPHTHLETMVRTTTQLIHSPLENRKGIQEKKTGKGMVCGAFCACMRDVLIRSALLAVQRAVLFFFLGCPEPAFLCEPPGFIPVLPAAHWAGETSEEY